jgi:AraC-type DNA-binding domain-containing proteins
MDALPIYLQAQNYFDINSPFFIDHGFQTVYFPPHRHDFIEMEFTLSGSGREIINGIEYELKSGSITVLLPWHIHETIPDKINPLELYKCSFGTEFFLNSNTPFFELSDIVFKNLSLPPITQLDAPAFEKLKSLFAEIQQEYSDLNLWKDTLIKAKVSEILIYFDRCRNLAQDTVALSSSVPKKLNIWKVIEYIHASFNRDITLVDISEKFHYSSSYLNKLLKGNIGLSFDEILQEVRIRNACAMLTYPLLSVNKIAMAIGYHSQEAFYRAFKSVKGTSPEKYRKLFLSHKDDVGKYNTRSVLNAQIIYYLHLHYNEDLTLSSLALAFHYNETYLSDILIQNDTSFLNLLHEIRIYHACTLLLTTEMPVSDIGFSVGFDSTETFFRVFRKLRDSSPGDYRKKYVAQELHIKQSI